MDNITLVGGFAINGYPLNCLLKLGSSIRFIDINSFPSTFSLGDMAGEVINKLNPECNNVLLGYSCGGLIALKVILLRPDLIRRIILINSSPKFIAEEGWSGIEPAAFSKLVDKLNRLKINDFLHYFIALAGYPARINDVQQFISSVDKSNLANLLAILQIADFRADMDKLGEQVFSIYSQHDNLVPPNILTMPYLVLSDSTHLKLYEPQLLRVISKICSKN